jgi:toxin-antitoxin system PIN domain toxin
LILVDANLLIGATMTSAPDHQATRNWLQDRLRGSAQVGRPWACLTGFVRLAAQPRAWERPLPVASALSVIRSWLSRPCAWIPQPGPSHLEILESLLATQPSVRPVTDAHIAAIATEHGLELTSRDRDFTRRAEQGLRSRDPIA